MLEKVFDVFVQAVPTIDRSTGGLGLDLTLVRRLVMLHGGTVTAHSEGSAKGGDVQALDPPPAKQKRRIVVVEDTADVAEPLKAFLENLGHEVVVARDGLEGVSVILDVCPDVALVDIGLPGIDGYEVARRVRAESRGAALYLVAATGYGGLEAKAEAERAGFDLHLTKPVDVRELRDVVSGKTRVPLSTTRERTVTAVLLQRVD